MVDAGRKYRSSPKGWRDRLEDGPREWPLQGERGDALGLTSAMSTVEPVRVEMEPAVLGIGGGQADHLAPVRVTEAVDGAVVDDLAVLVAPRRVEHLADPAAGWRRG